MINYDQESLFKNKNYLKNVNSTITSIKIIPNDLKIKKGQITKIWNKFITAKRENLIRLLKDIGINFQDLNKRQCYYCKNELTFINFFKINSSLGLGKVLDIWQNNLVNFVCEKCQEED